MVSNNSITSFMHYFSLHYAKASGKYQTSSLHRAAASQAPYSRPLLPRWQGISQSSPLSLQPLTPPIQPTQGQTAPDFMRKLTECKTHSKSKALNPALLYFTDEKTETMKRSDFLIHQSLFQLQPPALIQGRASSQC